MRQLLYTNYQSGNAGLSNAIMSIECGVVMAFLTKRFLLLDANISPPANIVDYDGRVDNSQPSRVTDLLEIPVPWGEPDHAELAQLDSHELARYSLMDSVFHVPGTVDIHCADALDFARGRSAWIGEDEQLVDVPLLRVSEEPLVPGTDQHRNNLSYYSYLFYLDPETRRATWELLGRMQARAPYAELARRVADDLGNFNAVHLRRGDFKVTYGVTVLDRNPWEAIDAMDKHFDRDETLVICTDERDDPFFGEITAQYSDHVFIDHHILDHYADDFAALPQHDSLALAYLTQLVAAQSQDFIGSMTSTFTGMIQRLRGNSGRDESFKFLWNELPDPGDTVERGSHPISECVPLENGIMVEEFDGPYSWNRVSQRLNPAWMREWPESFLTEDAVAVKSRPARRAATARPTVSEEATACFDGLRVRLRSSVPGLAAALDAMFHDSPDAAGSSVIAELDIDGRGGRYTIRAGRDTVAQVTQEEAIPSAIIDYLVPLLARARKHHSWLEGTVLARDGRSVLLVGDWQHREADTSIADALCLDGWSVVGDEVIPVRALSSEAVPFACCASPWMVTQNGSGEPVRLDAIVYGARQLQNRGSLFKLSPAAAVAELARSARDFAQERELAIKRLCKLVEQLPAYQLGFARPQETPAAFAALLRDLDGAH